MGISRDFSDPPNQGSIISGKLRSIFRKKFVTQKDNANVRSADAPR